MNICVKICKIKYNKKSNKKKKKKKRNKKKKKKDRNFINDYNLIKS